MVKTVSFWSSSDGDDEGDDDDGDENVFKLHLASLLHNPQKSFAGAW